MPDTLHRGDAIPGSRYVRDFCSTCREPIRVEQAHGKHTCADCKIDGGHIERSRDQRDRKITTRGGAADRQYHGGQFNRGEW